MAKLSKRAQVEQLGLKITAIPRFWERVGSGMTAGAGCKARPFMTTSTRLVGLPLHQKAIWQRPSGSMDAVRMLPCAGLSSRRWHR